VLTVSKTWPVAIPYGLAGTCTPDTPVPGKPNYTPLFGNVDHSGFPAVNGIRVKLCRTTGFSAENLAAAAIQTALEDKQEDLIYRVPVPGQLTVSINGWSGGEAQSKSFAINVPQWAGLSRLRLGKGGLFGSREAAAKFDAMGMPSELSYGSGGGADDIAGLIDTGREGVKALGNAELTRLQAEIALEEARQKLEALRASSDTASE
ncbi:MAG: hypothetical protein NWS68_04065, partial [Erythrobacter sp.]|nr:hypothetical protein [Erythrobacter sp.]